MMYGEVIWSSGKRIAAGFNSLRNNIRREAEYLIIKRTLLENLLLENPGGRVAGSDLPPERGSDLFNKSCCYFSVAGEGFKRNGDRLIGRGLSTFQLRDLSMS